MSVARLLVGGAAVWAQGTVTVMQTGGGMPLISKQETLLLGGLVNPEVVFQFGFVTDEAPTPGTLLDSFTVSLEGASSQQTALLATVDASGVLWAPGGMGTIPIADASIRRQAVAPPQQAPIGGRGVAFSVMVPVPAAFTGPTLEVNFDLFDNLNPAVMGLGWYTPPQAVAVPEPSNWALLAAAVPALAATWRRRA